MPLSLENLRETYAIVSYHVKTTMKNFLGLQNVVKGSHESSGLTYHLSSRVNITLTTNLN